MIKNIEDFQKLGKDQFEAATASASVFSKGFQQLATEATDYSKKSLEASSGLFEKLVGVKTLDKAIEAQTEYAKFAYESFLAQATKVSEICASMAKDMYRPLEQTAFKGQDIAVK